MTKFGESRIHSIQIKAKSLIFVDLDPLSDISNFQPSNGSSTLRMIRLCNVSASFHSFLGRMAGVCRRAVKPWRRAVPVDSETFGNWNWSRELPWVLPPMHIFGSSTGSHRYAAAWGCRTQNAIRHCILLKSWEADLLCRSSTVSKGYTSGKTAHPLNPGKLALNLKIKDPT